MYCGILSTATEHQVLFPAKKDVNEIKTRINGHICLCIVASYTRQLSIKFYSQRRKIRCKQIGAGMNDHIVRGTPKLSLPNLQRTFVYFQVPVMLIDTFYFGKLVIAPLNIMLYNVLSDHGPDLYGEW